MITSYGTKLDRYMNKAFSGNFVKLKPKDLVEQINLDPQITGIDVVVTYSTALKGITQEIRNIKKAFAEKHPDVKLIILADDGKNDAAINAENVFSENISRNFDSEDIKYVVEKVISSISTEESETYSAEEELESNMDDSFFDDEDDFSQEYIANVFDDKDENSFILSDEDEQNENEQENLYNESTVYETEEAKNIKTDFEEEIKTEKYDSVKERKTINENILSMQDYNTLEDVEARINKDELYKELLLTNTEFFNTNEALKVLDTQLSQVFRSKDLTAGEKLIAMQEIAADRAVLKGRNNSIFADSLSNIINNMINVTALRVDEELNTIRQRFANISEKELYKGNTELVSRLTKERCDMQRKMSGDLVKIVRLYDHLTSTVVDSQKAFVEGIPSSNPYINSYLKPAVGIAPKDLTKHIELLFKALNDGKMKLSAMESEIRALIETSSKICELSDSIIAAQEEIIETMKVQRIEDVVIVDSLLKNALRLYCGSENSGKTASAAIINEIHRRKGNTLFIDMTRANKAAVYIPNMVNIADVIERPNRGEYEFLYCRSREKIDFDKLIEYLNDCTTHFRFINILTDFDRHIINLQEYALSVNIFLKPDISSISRAKAFIKSVTHDNIAKRICVVNPSVEPSEMFNILDISPSEYKYASIPNMPEINKATLRRTNPGINRDIRIIFEEQFQ